MKTFLGFTALLTAFPPCLGRDETQTHPLLSGSVCRVRDSLDFLDPVPRAEVTRAKRLAIADDEFKVGPTCHITNGDEDDETLMLAGQYHKTLPHDRFGQVNSRNYQKLLDCVFSSDINVCEDVPSGGGRDGAKLTNPLGGAAHQVDGADSDNIFIATPDSLLSERLAAQQTELYWMALARDIPFSQFDTNDLIQLAAENLQKNEAFCGLNIPTTKDTNSAGIETERIDPVTDLFRTDWPGVTTGPIVSQFLVSDFEIDSIDVEPKAAPLFPRMDYMTSFRSWLDVQNGGSDVETVFDKENPRFIRNGRDLATIAFRDVLYTEAFRAALILFVQGALGGSVGPYAVSNRQQGFATFGEPHILTAMAASSSSTRHAWYAKWQVHRMLRPEAYGGLVHNTLMGNVNTPLPDSLLKNTDLLDRVEKHNFIMNSGREKAFLLPMAVAEGSPTHPAYPSGHAINVGAYITTLKAFLGFERGQRCFPNPVISNDEGTDRVPYVPTGREIVGQCTDETGKLIDGLTYEGELNKISANVLLGRSHIGVHWRMDGVNGATMGQTSAIRRLQQELPGLSEARVVEGAARDAIPQATYSFRLYSGQMIELYGRNLYKLDGKLCEGPYTGDDLCDEVQEDTFDSFEDAVEELATLAEVKTEL